MKINILKDMLKTCLLLSQLTIFSTFAAEGLSSGGGGAIAGGGGDADEMRFDYIRADLLSWISAGGAENLELINMSLDDYTQRMSLILKPQHVVIAFVEKDHPTDREKQVNVEGVPKTCRGFISNQTKRPHIVCNSLRFNALNTNDKYKLIHHEYAGLVLVERNDGPSSDYHISNQIVTYLSSGTEKKLIVKTLKTATKRAIGEYTELKKDLLDWIKNGNTKSLPNYYTCINKANYENLMIDVLSNNNIELDFSEFRVRLFKQDNPSFENLLDYDERKIIADICYPALNDYTSEFKVYCNVQQWQKATPQQRYATVHSLYAHMSKMERSDYSYSCENSYTIKPFVEYKGNGQYKLNPNLKKDIIEETATFTSAPGQANACQEALKRAKAMSLLRCKNNRYSQCTVTEEKIITEKLNQKLPEYRNAELNFCLAKVKVLAEKKDYTFFTKDFYKNTSSKEDFESSCKEAQKRAEYNALDECSTISQKSCKTIETVQIAKQRPIKYGAFKRYEDQGVCAYFSSARPE